MRATLHLIGTAVAEQVEVIKAFAGWSYLNHGMQSLSGVVSTADSAMPVPVFLLKENSTNNAITEQYSQITYIHKQIESLIGFGNMTGKKRI